ncbi:rhodanese-like domain-containing protein, partial [Methylogaea oryzae]
VRDLAQMRRLAESGDCQLVDARSAGRFEGRDPEPRPGLKSGHIPGSRSLPFAELVDAETRLMLPLEEVRRRFGQAGIDPARPVAATCGTGVTAAILALALYRLGREDVAVYDGSWSEWGALPDVPVATGAA